MLEKKREYALHQIVEKTGLPVLVKNLDGAMIFVSK